MNYRLIANQLAIFAGTIGVLLALDAAFAGIDWASGEAAERPATFAFLIASAAGIVPGGLLWLMTRGSRRRVERREAILLVACSWILGAGLAGLPYFLWAHLADASTIPAERFRNPVNAYFEATSGLTTTGATVLEHIHTLPRSLLLWRCATHWFGGLGIIVLFVAVFPSLGVGGKKLFRFESSGPEKTGVQPNIRDTAVTLWTIYLSLSAAQFVLLVVAGVGWFDAVCHTFSTMGTGGFSNSDASVAGFRSSGANVIIIVFMFLAGANFSLYYHGISGRWRDVLADTELRAYAAFVVLASIIIALAILPSAIRTTDGRELPPGMLPAAMHGTFQAVSIVTTTGFCTADSDQWPVAAKAVLTALMFIGGCAGSTAGGIKVIRVWVTLKVLVAEVQRVFRPHVITHVRVGGQAVDPQMKLAILAYAMGMVALFAGGATALLVIEPAGTLSLTDACSSSVATLCTIGPGFGRVGATMNYSFYSDASKIVLCLLMLLGRLEIFAIACLFYPKFWKGE